MADQDDTSKPARRRRNRLKNITEAPTAGTANYALPTGLGPIPDPPPPPRTLEEAVERVRALLLEVRAMLHCLSEVLMHTDDDDGVLHAQVAEAAARWINEAAADLDLVKLLPLIQALAQRKYGPSSGESGSGNLGAHQVREPTRVYHVAA